MLPRDYYEKPSKDFWLFLGSLLILGLIWLRFFRSILPRQWEELLTLKILFGLLFLVQLLVLGLVLRGLFLPPAKAGALLSKMPCFWQKSFLQLALLLKKALRSPFRFLAFLWEMQGKAFRHPLYERFALCFPKTTLARHLDPFLVVLECLPALLVSGVFLGELFQYHRLAWLLLWKASWAIITYVNGKHLVQWESHYGKVRFSPDCPRTLEAQLLQEGSEEEIADWSQAWLAGREVADLLAEKLGDFLNSREKQREMEYQG